MIHDLISRALWGLCGLLPIDRKKVLFSSYYGRGYSDSPKAIAQALLDSGEDVKLCWLVKSPEEAATLPEGVTPIDQNNAFQRILAYSTSKVWVDNCRKYVRRKRKGQFYLQTWHGFALKMIESDATQALEDEYIRGSKADSAQTDLIVSGSAFMTGLYKRSFWYDGEVAELGTPRNDIFFGGAELSEKVHAALGLPESRRLLLYAPTFRADHSLDCYALDPEKVRQACQSRFGGEWSVLIRLHPNIASKSAGLYPYDGETILDATAYPDMQELLAGVDLLITDYSSSMFDYALTGKPCIQFALDVESYAKERNFYFPLDELPFPMARSNEELDTIIRNYDQTQWSDRWEQFKRNNDFCEDGKAARRCAELILQHTK